MTSGVMEPLTSRGEEWALEVPVSPSVKRLLVALVFVDFLAISAWAMWKVGYFGIWAAAISGPGELQVLADLFVACGLASAWVLRDARERGVNAWPFVVAALPFGSIPLLGYVLVRDWLPTTARGPAPV